MKKKPQYLENGKALKGHDPINVYNGLPSMGNENITSVYQDVMLKSRKSTELYCSK